MRVEFDDDEVLAALTALTKAVLESGNLSDEDRGRLRRWLSDDMRPGRDNFKALHDKVNTDIARVLKGKQRGLIQKHDWV